MSPRAGRLHARYATVVVFGLAVLALASPAWSQPYDLPPTWGGDYWERPRLTGSWDGGRDELGRRGVVVDVDWLQVPQGVVSGGRDRNAEYGGLFEYTLNADSQKLGLWPGAFLKVQGMSSYGRNVDKASGALLPPNFISILPEGPNVTGLMNLSFMQFLSPKFGVLVGKLSGLGGDDNAFAHDYHSQFLNSGLNLNMALAMFPFTSYGGGFVFVPWDGAIFTAMVLDPDGTAKNNDISEAFSEGVNVNAEGRVTVKPFGLVGHQLVGFGWSDKKRISLEQDPSNIARMLVFSSFPRLANPGPILRRILERFFPQLLVPVEPPKTTNNTWAVYYNFDQYLWSPESHPDRGIGLFFRFGITDGVANPIKYTYNAGLSGNGIIPGRPNDNFGVGWSRVSFSSKLVPLLRDRLRLGLEQEDAIEMYYNASVTKWLGATLDLQIIDPALKKTLNSDDQLQDNKTSAVLGLRMYVRF